MSLEKVLEGLNPSQREVVDCRTNCAAIAVPGAGKTATIAAKAAVLLADPNVTVGAVTFSKDAAVELRERIVALAGASAKKRLLAGTFHSLAYKQLGKGTGKLTDIVNDGIRFAIVGRILEESGIDWKVEDAIAAIERAKMDLGGPPGGTIESQLYEAYQSALARNGKIDFQDMLRLAVSGMQQGTITPYRVAYLLVDEYQDCDSLQSRWTALHAAAGSIVTVVGDDDQSIYGFRSALGYKGMEAFISEFEARPVILGKNYRSHSEILATADRVIRNNKDRIQKDLVAHRGPGGAVDFKRMDDEYAEAVAAVEALAPVLRAGKTAAVLARTNRILDPLEAVCRSHGVKYYRAAGRSILDRPEAALVGDLLELIQVSKSSGIDALLGFAGIGSHELQLLHAKADQKPGGALPRKKDLVEAGIAESTVDKYRDFLKKLAEWRALCERQLFSLILDGVREWMLKFVAEDAGKRAVNTAYDVLSRLNGPFLDRLAFLRQKNNEPADDALVLTTMHASKGREWSAVAVIRAEETIVPDEASPESEERRLFYVALTRARDWLQVSTAKKNPTSRFVVEAGLA
ncbi:Superfamily I DNA or RNA helicase [Cupriavidus sp. YR651]|uniref:ATP-dependent helicase n=1 Tax=Cupriavidus sp. YR651 TaxID=1855315 RepID=UPI000888F59E|nr:ATP-dependent helicase [Cupriavidus sp. YR651]SDD56846.1 Superfamily I DNA or RNA helicase [Cupriavidus sp. YR651]